MAQREHDGAHHGDQQDHARDLEKIGIAGIEHEADHLDIRHLGRNRRGDRVRNAGPNHPGADHQQQLGEENAADQHADRQILQRALLELGEIDVEHHHHEQEQHGDGADIDHDQDHGQEFGAQHHEQPGRVDEGEDEIEHGMHRVLRGDHHEGARHANAGKEIEEQRSDDHHLTLKNTHRYGASSAWFLAISRSQRSPFASSRSLS